MHATCLVRLIPALFMDRQLQTGRDSPVSLPLPPPPVGVTNLPSGQEELPGEGFRVLVIGEPWSCLGEAI